MEYGFYFFKLEYVNVLRLVVEFTEILDLGSCRSEVWIWIHMATLATLDWWKLHFQISLKRFAQFRVNS